MAHAVRARQERHSGERQADSEELTEIAGTNPDAQASTDSAKEDDGWITFDKPVLFLFAGQGPYVSRFVIAVSNFRPLPAGLAGS
jgi:sphingosine kinase